MSPTVRAYRADDAAALGRLFFDSVHRGTAEAYSKEQRSAWAPAAPSGAVWERRLGQATTFVAEIDGAPVGFMSLKAEGDDSGRVDMAFVHPDHMGRGVAAALYAALEAAARSAGLRRLETDASEVARPFFAAKGFAHVGTQHPVRRGVRLTNHRMGKTL